MERACTALILLVGYLTAVSGAVGYRIVCECKAAHSVHCALATESVCGGVGL